MSADRIDHSRDDTNRAERERADRRRERPTVKVPVRTDFATRFEQRIRAKDRKETEETKAKDGKDRARVREKSEKGSLFTRIVEVAAKHHKEQQKEFSGKQEGEKEGGEQAPFGAREESPFKSDVKMKDTPRQKEEEKGEEKGPKDSRTGRSGEKTEHAKVESVGARHDGEKGSGGGGGSGGTFSGGGGGSSSGRGDGNSSSFSGGGRNPDSSSGGRDQFKGKPTEGVKSVRAVGSFEAQGESTSGGQRHLQSEEIDQMIAAVRIALGPSGEKEMEIEMSDAFFSGLKLKVATSASGVVITFVCPNRDVMRLLLINRPRIYEALAAKKISVARVDVIPL